MYKHAYPSSADEAWHLPKRASYVHVHVHVTFGLCNDSTHNLVIRVHVHIHGINLSRRTGIITRSTRRSTVTSVRGHLG